MKVSVLEPQLEPSKLGPVNVAGAKAVVTARWMPKDETASWESVGDTAGEEGKDKDKDKEENWDGRVEWVCTDVQAGAGFDLNLVWEVNAPVDVQWTQV